MMILCLWAMMWLVKNIGVAGELHTPPATNVYWTPVWLNFEHDVLKTERRQWGYHEKQTNLEHWRKLLIARVEDVAPRRALGREHCVGWSSIYYHTTQEHYPWHVHAVRNCLEPDDRERVLSYQVVESPSFKKPNYVAIVYCMPTIRCQARTIEELRVKLLASYKDYLLTVIASDEQKAQYIVEDGINKNWISFLICGPTPEVNKPHVSYSWTLGALAAENRELSKASKPLNCFDDKSIATQKASLNPPNIYLRSGLLTNEEQLIRKTKAYLNQNGKDANLTSPGYWDLIFPYGHER